jgi:hypothetical protein
MRFADDCRRKALALLETANEGQENNDQATDLARAWLVIALIEDMITVWADQVSERRPGAITVCGYPDRFELEWSKLTSQRKQHHARW